MKNLHRNSSIEEEIRKALNNGIISAGMSLTKSFVNELNKIDEVKVEKHRNNFGKHEGYYQWDLAVNWFRMSNDGFYNMYGFNFVPRGRLYEDAREFVHNNYQ